MADKSPIRDRDIESIMGTMLRVGVVISAMIVFAGCSLYLWENGSRMTDHHRFMGEPASLRHPDQIVTDAMQFQSESMIQFGLLLLVLTPVTRILFSIIGFLIEKDYLYVSIGVLVLAIIVASYLGQLAS